MHRPDQPGRPALRPGDRRGAARPHRVQRRAAAGLRRQRAADLGPLPTVRGRDHDQGLPRLPQPAAGALREGAQPPDRAGRREAVRQDGLHDRARP